MTRGVLQRALASIDKHAWLRFLVASVGLSAAFTCALLSTITRQAGDVLGTAVLASAALLIAAWVGVTTVPYLARRVAFSRVRDVLDYELTREGLAYIGLVVLVGVAALNTGNNLLFIILSALLAAILVSGVASAAVLRSLELEITVPDRVFARTAVLARIVVRNTRRFLPVLSVAVVAPALAGEMSQSAHRWSRRNWDLWRRLWRRLTFSRKGKKATASEPRAVLQASVYFPYVPARTSASADVELRFARRGCYLQESFGLATRFPFSFLLKTRRIPLRAEVLVYPAVEQTDALFEVLPLITGEFESSVAGRGYDLHRIREYAAGDSARHVDWKSSAKTGSLMVREFTREDQRKVRMVFDNPARDTVSASDYEKGITLAASLAWHFAGENAQLTFVTPDLSSSADLYDFLRYLALVEPGPSNGLLESLPPTPDYNIIFTARPRGSIPTPLWSSSYFLFFD